MVNFIHLNNGSAAAAAIGEAGIVQQPQQNQPIRNTAIT